MKRQFVAALFLCAARRAAGRAAPSSPASLMVLLTDALDYSTEEVYRWIGLPSPSPSPRSDYVEDYADYKSATCFAAFGAPCYGWYDGASARSLVRDETGERVRIWVDLSGAERSLLPDGPAAAAPGGGAILAGGSLLDTAAWYTHQPDTWSVCAALRNLTDGQCVLFSYGGLSLSMRGSDLSLSAGGSSAAAALRSPGAEVSVCVSAEPDAAALYVSAAGSSGMARAAFERAPSSGRLVLGPTGGAVTYAELVVLSVAVDEEAAALVLARFREQWRGASPP